MRIWYGIDVEHNPMFGKMMLFVESENPDIDIVLNCLTTLNVGIDGVYFGAGEQDIKDWSFLDRLDEVSDAFVVCIETSVPISKDIGSKFDFVILRLSISYISDNIYIKYRTPETVGLVNSSAFEPTELRTLYDNKYLGDIEIYNNIGEII